MNTNHTGAVSVLSAKGLMKTYGKRTVVKDVGLEVKSGEVVGLLGPNGAGKTTSLPRISKRFLSYRKLMGRVYLNQKLLQNLMIYSKNCKFLIYAITQPYHYQVVSVAG